jgi:anti-sigma B factor antagonist
VTGTATGGRSDEFQADLAVGRTTSAKLLPFNLHRSGECLGMLKFTARDVSGVLVLAFEPTEEGAGDWQTTERDWLYKLVETHPDSRFAIDLSDVNYLASSEIGFLVTLKRRIDRRRGNVVVFGAAPYIHELFQTMNLTRILDIVDTFPAALAKLGPAGK